MKVFCIGLNKTGTRSLHEALQRLGLRSLHWGGPERGPQIRALAERALREGRPLLDDIEDADAYSDILALSANFDIVDGQYPGSKFILTVRGVDAWLDSRRRHVETNLARRERGEYHGTFLTVDTEAWTAEMAEHVGRIRSYFSGRPDDLLVMDIAAGDGW
ncbi:MAG: sulfotransferase, partial [Acidimicrobiales bacterium]